MERSFYTIAKTSLILVYLVIVAGAVVRMTGSGMGCPDWPKCFGYYVPPTDIETLEWQPNRDFKKGQVIIVQETLQVAKIDFKTKTTFDSANWAPYTKHDYAKFNVWHTWIEYINRLVGALAGLATLVMAVISFRFWKRRKKITFLSWFIVLGMGFQAWLGATVVYSLLAPVRITLHMLMALVIVGAILYVMYIVSDNHDNYTFGKTFRSLVLFSLVLTFIQVALGTQVRQYVDEQAKLMGEYAKDQWLLSPTLNFYIHRSFSILVLIINAAIYWQTRKNNWKLPATSWIMVLIGFEVLSGILMYYVDFPFGSQPVHLVLASILFGLQFYLFLKVYSPKMAKNSL